MIAFTDACRPDVRRALQTDPGVLLVGRSADSSGWALDRCISDVYIAALYLAWQEGVDVRRLLPKGPVLGTHHRTEATVERMETTDGTTVMHRWSLWTPSPTSSLTVLLSTGSARAATAGGLDQAGLHRVAWVVHETRPSVVYARSLPRIGRGYPGALVDVLQAIGETQAHGPFLGDETMGLAPVDLALPWRLVSLGLTSAAYHRRLANQPRLPNGRFAGRRPVADGSAR